MCAGVGPAAVFFVKIAEDRLGPFAGAEDGAKHPFGQKWRCRAIMALHDSSLPSTPCHRLSKLRRDARTAARPAGVTVK